MEYKVLIIEDDKPSRRMLAKAIEKEGFCVVTAEDGKQGVSTFEKESPHIVVSDLKIPELSGVEVFRRVKKLNPQVQFILVTAFGETDTAIEVLREGAMDYIKKPIDLDVLSVALGRAKERVDHLQKTTPYPNILLAEDDDAARERLKGVLEKEGWRIITASNGEEALDIFKTTKIDLALLDIKMPKKDGLTCLEEFRKLSKDFEAIIITGYGNEDSAIKAMRNGAMNFIKKPIDIEHLSVVVGKAMEKLNIERSLKYRIHELQLARELIARITVDHEVILSLQGIDQKKNARDFAIALLNALPIYVVAVGQDMNIAFMNSSFLMTTGSSSEKFDESFFKSLTKIGIEGISFKELSGLVKKLFDGPVGQMETVKLSKYVFLFLIPIIVNTDGKEEKLILMAIRGDKK